jgi:hypothetical protein
LPVPRRPPGRDYGTDSLKMGGLLTQPERFVEWTGVLARSSAALAGASLNVAILAIPRHTPGRQRTSGRTAAERRTRHTEEVMYTIEIMKSNLPKWDTIPEA